MALRVTAAAQRRLVEIRSQLVLARRAAEVSRETLSGLAAVSSRALYYWEQGRDTPNLDHLLSWARELGFRIHIVAPSGERPGTQVEPVDGESWETREMRRLVEPLRSRRVARELSQEDLSLLMGVSRSSVQRWEEAQQFPRSITLIVWAGRLGYEIELGRSSAFLAAASRPVVE